MRLTVIGASGHGRVVADVARLCGYDEISFLDDDGSLSECGGWPVVGSSGDAPAEGDLFVAVGDAGARERLMRLYGRGRFPVLAHPSAVVARDVEIGAGTVVAAGAVLNPGARLGVGVIVNTCASVDHDCVVGDFAHVSVGARLCGAVRVGERTWVGAGAVVRNNVSVCGGCTIGAGAVVVRDVEVAGTYVGCPAALMRAGEGLGGAA